MRRVRFFIGVKDSLEGLRTLFYGLSLLLLLLYSVSETSAAASSSSPHHGGQHQREHSKKHSNEHSDNHSEHTAGMGAPPPLLLESYPRLATFGNPERRLLGTLPVAVYLRMPGQVWNAVLLLSAPKTAAYTGLAMFQQWQLEGG